MADIAKLTNSSAKLSEDIFNVDVKNHELLKLAYDNYLANSRNAHPKSKARGEVSGGGRKPWRQKGTGRARFGSSRNPIWRGGGVAFGPKGNENHILSIPVASKRIAIKQALTLANKKGKITVINSIACSEGKTKEIVKLLTSNKIDSKANVLLVTDIKDDMLLRATGNINQIKTVKPMYLNVFDILNADKIIITKNSLPIISNWLVKPPKSSLEDSAVKESK